MDGPDTTVRVDGAPLSSGVSAAGATDTGEVNPLTVTKRLQRDGRWPEIEPLKNQLIKDARKQGMSKADAQAWAYSEIDRLYPPEPEPANGGIAASAADKSEEPANGGSKPADGQIQGLATIPDDWPALPGSVSMAVELAWVQANRLRLVSTAASGAQVVDLLQALTPAPSWSALSWLETSIRSYAKFVDVCAKYSSGSDDEAEHVRRERLALREITDLLAEMHAD
jgi:hypothetical protein